MFGSPIIRSNLSIMKKYLPFISALAFLLALGSCSHTAPGPQGPAGPQGPEGPIGPKGADGENGFVFEWEGISFTSPSYEVILPYPENFEGLDSDVALVYFLWGVDDNGLEIWRQLPQTLVTADGILSYNFDFTKFDVRVFLQAEFPLDWLTAIDTDDWVARVVVVPGSFWNSGRIDFADYRQVEEALGLPSFDAPDSSLRR